jgi:hypothetical protein
VARSGADARGHSTWTRPPVLRGWPVGPTGLSSGLADHRPAAEPDREAVVGVHECDLDIELVHDPEP